MFNNIFLIYIFEYYTVIVTLEENLSELKINDQITRIIILLKFGRKNIFGFKILIIFYIFKKSSFKNMFKTL